MEYIDYYKVLGVTKSATEKDIKKAYRKMARKYHPDVNPNDAAAEKKFKEVNEANEVLGNTEKRKKYDQYGKDWMHAEQFEKAKAQQGSRGGGQQYGQDFGGGDFSDFFESMFGGGGGFSQRGGQQARFRGQDLNAQLRLNLYDAFKTQKQTLTVNGKNIRLTIPAGIENGQTIKIPGHGGPGRNGGPKGDLYLKFIIDNNTPFKRDGNNLYKDVDVDLYTAILGGEITVDTFDGKAKLKIKPETQSGTKVKLKGKGFPIYKKEGQFGDLYITYNIKTPTNLSDKEKELFTQLASLKN
ncbi:J domain-containing protein [Zobellia amurskyensis]|uniref:J domain-containing protein n=1 Tax=Zobellia amurskyensis TaxID=248905 RepID=A0A7X3D348_9FLAO|nr:J domain-containing protein [Zobellia amurskyensis]MUH37131.1 J domain-containing protein [Zobellia amurskyensis]